MAPSFENMLVPVPVVLSPAAGYRNVSHYRRPLAHLGTYGLVDSFMEATGHLVSLHGFVGAVLHGFR